MNVISLKNITKEYSIGDQTFMALKGISMDVRKGEYVSIMGPSGSGKSTMLYTIGALDTPTSGTYLLDDKNVTKMSDDELSKIRNEKIGFVFQSFNLLPKISVIENVMLPFMYSSVDKKKRKERAIKALEMVQIADKLNNKPNQLSGGQIQRVAIARSIVMEPSILLADEPTGNLDTKTGNQILDIFDNINKEGGTIILITHDKKTAKHSQRIIHLKDGLVVDKL